MTDAQQSTYIIRKIRSSKQVPAPSSSMSQHRYLYDMNIIRLIKYIALEK